MLERVWVNHLVKIIRKLKQHECRTPRISCECGPLHLVEIAPPYSPSRLPSVIIHILFVVIGKPPAW